MSPESRFYTNKTFYELLQSVAQQHPEDEALVVGDARLTYQALLERADTLAAGLSRLGIRKGDKVGIILPACTENHCAFFALAKIGAPWVSMSPQLRASEVRHILGDSGAVAVITVAELFGHDYLSMIESIRPSLPNLRHVIAMGGDRGEGVIPLETLLAPGEQEAPLEKVTPDDLMAIFYTSGTTGLPKGALHSHRRFLAMSGAFVETTQLGLWDNLLNAFPPFHLAGTFVPLMPLPRAGKLVLMERFNPQEMLRLSEKERITGVVGAPAMFGFMLRMPDFDQYDLSSLRVCLSGGGPFPRELIHALKERIGCGVINLLGITEAGVPAMTRADDPEDLQATTIGRPTPGAEVKIVDDEGREVAVGVAGEIVVRTPSLMLGYYKRPEQTAEILDAEGWYHTGDIGSLDEQGYLRIFDRKKDMIIRGGANIYPAEIENYLVTHPKIQMAAVIGVPSAIGGERVRAYVLPREGQGLTATEMLDYCRGRIAAYKIPDEVRFVDSFPLTALRKVQKFKLRQEVARELAELEKRSN